MLLSLLAAAALMISTESDTITDRGPEEPSESQTLLQSAAEGLSKIKHLRARFKQVGPSGEMMTGTLYLSRPGRLRFEYDAPNPTLMVATGGLLYIHDQKLKSTDTYPIGETPLRFLLNKELDLDAAQVVAVHESEYGLKITLAAKDSQLRGHLTLVFEPETLALEGWSFIDENNEATLVDLQDVEEVRRLNNRLFRIPETSGAFLRDQ